MSDRQTVVHWCKENNLSVNDMIRIKVVWPKEWIQVKITAIGERAILVRYGECREFEWSDVQKTRNIKRKKQVPNQANQGQHQ